jgi:hypothetical protein
MWALLFSGKATRYGVHSALPAIIGTLTNLASQSSCSRRLHNNYSLCKSNIRDVFGIVRAVMLQGGNKSLRDQKQRPQGSDYGFDVDLPCISRSCFGLRSTSCSSSLWYDQLLLTAVVWSKMCSIDPLLGTKTKRSHSQSRQGFE